MARADWASRSRMLLGFLGGALAALLLTPQSGARRRRALLRDALRSRGRRLGAFARKAGTDVRNRALGTGARARRAFADDAAPDEVLAERVRARLGREVSHPRALQVEVRDGVVQLSGPILDHETKRVLRAAASVRGVRSVEDRLERHTTRAGVPALQGGTDRHARPEWLQENWAPATRVGAAALGGGLALLGTRVLAGGALLGAAPLALGGGLLLRAFVNLPVRRALALRGGREAVELERALEVEPPFEQGKTIAHGETVTRESVEEGLSAPR